MMQITQVTKASTQELKETSKKGTYSDTHHRLSHKGIYQGAKRDIKIGYIVWMSMSFHQLINHYYVKKKKTIKTYFNTPGLPVIEGQIFWYCHSQLVPKQTRNQMVRLYPKLYGPLVPKYLITTSLVNSYPQKFYAYNITITLILSLRVSLSSIMICLPSTKNEGI